MATKRIFISYRREDATPYALALRAELERRLGGIHVFLDTQRISAASQWPARLQDGLFQCDAFLALIGPKWLSSSNADGLRLFDTEDWVRREVAYALQHKPGLLLPILVDEGKRAQRGQGSPVDV